MVGHKLGEFVPTRTFKQHSSNNKAADSAALAEAVNRLPAEFKEVVLLHYYQGYNVSEISEILNIAEGTVSSRLSRARKRMQNELKGE